MNLWGDIIDTGRPGMRGRGNPTERAGALTGWKPYPYVKAYHCPKRELRGAQYCSEGRLLTHSLSQSGGIFRHCLDLGTSRPAYHLTQLRSAIQVPRVLLTLCRPRNSSDLCTLFEPAILRSLPNPPRPLNPSTILTTRNHGTSETSARLCPRRRHDQVHQAAWQG